MQYFFSFDVESNGLFGASFAVGWVIVDENGKEHEEGYIGCDPPPEIDPWVMENVIPVLPRPEHDFSSMLRMFWLGWKEAQDKYPGILMLADCPFPVEATFLSWIIEPMEESPYPIIDVASVLFAKGMDPIGTYDRLPTELPAHHPTNDARQSVRVMLEALRGTL